MNTSWLQTLLSHLVVGPKVFHPYKTTVVHHFFGTYQQGALATSTPCARQDHLHFGNFCTALCCPDDATSVAPPSLAILPILVAYRVQLHGFKNRRLRMVGFRSWRRKQTPFCHLSKRPCGCSLKYQGCVPQQSACFLVSQQAIHFQGFATVMVDRLRQRHKGTPSLGSVVVWRKRNQKQIHVSPPTLSKGLRIRKSDSASAVKCGHGSKRRR